MALADLCSTCWKWNSSSDCLQGQTRVHIQGKHRGPFLLSPCSLPTYMPPSCFKTFKRRPLAEGADVCTKGNSTTGTWTTQKPHPFTGSPCIAPGSLSAAGSGRGTGSPSFSELSFLQGWTANPRICALFFPRPLWGSNEIMYVKRFVNCKMLYKCKGLL